MANIQERRDKAGRLISYSIRVHRGRGSDGKQLKPWTATFEVSPTWTERSARKKAEAFAATFEKECRAGVTTDSRQKFEPYCEYVIAMKEQRGAKHSTIVRYKELTERIYPAIGHIKLKDLRADHLNSFYTALGKPGQNKRTGSGLSAKTILEHHRLISTVLDQAEKEGQVPFNVAAKATLPKVAKREVNYFQPEQIVAIRDALKQEPLKWETLTHLFLLTGARRGELLGLKWSAVDFEKNRVHICNNVLYAPDRGIYEDTPKTATSDPLYYAPSRDNTASPHLSRMAEHRAAASGRILRESGLCFLAGERQPHAPGQRDRLDEQIQQAPRPAAYQSPCVPAHNGVHALF